MFNAIERLKNRGALMVKNSHLGKAIATGVLVASAAILPACTPEPVEPIAQRPGVGVVAERDDGFDWGWIGLVGLFGLLGLGGKGKRRTDATAYREP